MSVFSNYASLPFFDQLLHGLHFMLCAFAILIAAVPLLTEKGSVEHKCAGLIYIPVSLTALLLASFMAWREESSVLFCFICFCTYLLMSGWRAVHEDGAPSFIDLAIPGSLFILAFGVALNALMEPVGKRSLYLLFFAFNAFYLSWRDWRHLQQRITWDRQKIFLGDGVSTVFGALPLTSQSPQGWLGRHIAGMIGSVTANISVIILTLLPLELHWLWPTTLLSIGAVIAFKQHEKKARIRKALAPLLRPGFGRVPLQKEDQKPLRRAA